MASRRMFSLAIINSARFLKMPIDSQVLYFHLGLRADDDGIVEAYPIMKMLGNTEDNLRVLVAKNFVKVLNEDLVSFITDWKQHNLIRADRKVDSIYRDLLLQVIPEVKLVKPRKRADTKRLTGQRWTTNGQPMDSIGKVRLGKDRLGKIKEKKEKKEKLIPAEEMRLFLKDKDFFGRVISSVVGRTEMPEEYVVRELKVFRAYWSELNKSGTKQRWELQSTFQLGRRIATWLRNGNKFSQSKGKKVFNLIK